MAKLVNRVHPKDETRTEQVEVKTLDDLQLGDVVGPGVLDMDAGHPHLRSRTVERTIHEQVDGSVTLELTELEAQALKALLGQTNGLGGADLGDATHNVWDALRTAEVDSSQLHVETSGTTIWVAHGPGPKKFIV